RGADPLRDRPRHRPRLRISVEEWPADLRCADCVRGSKPDKQKRFLFKLFLSCLHPRTQSAYAVRGPFFMTERPVEEWSLPTRHLGRRVWRFARLDSTNRVAAAAPADVAGLADEQTARRGPHGRARQWPPGVGGLARRGGGVVRRGRLAPPPDRARPAVLAAWAAVAVAEVVRRQTGLQAKVKWPNDVLLRGRKVCGVLVESAGGRVVVGVGLN